MNEKDVRLLFEAGHWTDATVIRNSEENGWHVLLLDKNTPKTTQILSAKRGNNRVFKTSDSALQWCKELGFLDITIQFNTLNNLPEIDESSSIVLLVEDNPDDVLLTRRAFATSNLKITLDVACDGQDALDYIFAKGKYSHRENKDLPQLILLDINLPKLSGLEVLKRIRTDDATKFVPVVLLTTSDECCDVVEGYESGGNSFIKKPVNFSVFSEVIQSLGDYWLNINTPHPGLSKA